MIACTICDGHTRPLCGACAVEQIRAKWHAHATRESPVSLRVPSDIVTLLAAYDGTRARLATFERMQHAAEQILARLHPLPFDGDFCGYVRELESAIVDADAASKGAA